MCGIIGCIANRNVRGILLEGLKRMEYRGYDSAGLALLKNKNGKLTFHHQRECGKVAKLVAQVNKQKPDGIIGIAHTRWATHGAVTTANAHPHIVADRIAVVHNGIVENYLALKQELSKKGHEFKGDSDTEVIAHLIARCFAENKKPLVALQKAVKRMEGAYALAILDLHQPNMLFAVRKGSPLVIGLGEEENFVASDPLALLQVTDRFIYLEDEEMAFISDKHIDIRTFGGRPVQRDSETYSHHYTSAERGQFSHYMLKEIYEQPKAVENTLLGRITSDHFLPETLGLAEHQLFHKVENLYITGCGTSYHAALIARYFFEEYCGISVKTDVASEFRYMQRTVPPNCLYVTISQSGETADVLAALATIGSKAARPTSRATANHSDNFIGSLAICNVPSSTLVRACDLPLMLMAGPEIGVASTKAFTAQLTGLLLLLGFFWHIRGERKKEKMLVAELRRLPDLMRKVLKLRPQIKEMAQQLTSCRSSLFIGRGSFFPLALEGALKLKEISYIHAEAYPGGELKHGPLALVERDMPTIALVGQGVLGEKIKSNMQEVIARQGPLYIFSDKKDAELSAIATELIQLPPSHPLITPLLFAIPLQLLAYEVAVLLGTDVDQPRNLAKSVTVE